MLKVYKYGLLAPSSNGELVRSQMRAAHGYRNTLVEIERGRRAAIRSILAEHGSEPALEHAVTEAEAALEDAERAIKSRRAETRSRSEKQAQRDVLREARERLKKARAASGGAVAVHLGWLETGRGLRVATWMDTTGETGELVLGRGDLDTTDIDGGRGGVLSGVRKAEDLRSIRDKNFNDALDALVAWLRDHDMPEWMRALTVRRGSPMPSKAQAVSYLSGWRSSARLASLAKRWSDARFDGDKEAFDGLEAWRYHDYHLWQWEANQRLSALRRRREVYRRVSADLATRYSTVLVDGMKLDGIARRPRTEDGPEIEASRSNRQAAAVSEFRGVLENAVKSRGGTAGRIDAAKQSITCPGCGTEDEAHVDAKGHSFACTTCTFVSDVDKAALLNMLRRGGFGDAVDRIIERWKQVANALRSGAKGDDAHG